MASGVDLRLSFTIAAQHGAFHRLQLYEAGGDRHLLDRRLRAGVWAMATRDVIVLAASPDTWSRRLWVGQLEAGDESAVARRSALAVLGLRGFEPGPVDITRHERYQHVTTTSDLHVTSWFPREHVVQVDGLRCTSLSRSLFELAGMTSPKRLRHGLPFVSARKVARAVADARVHLGLKPADLDTIVGELGKRGRPGTTLMRRLAAEHGEGTVATESELEDLFVRVLAANGVPAPVRQLLVRTMTPWARVDFCFQAARLVIECDGRKYHSALQDMDRDRWRSNELAADGWFVIRVSWFDLVHQPERVVRLIRRALKRAGLPTRVAAA